MMRIRALAWESSENSQRLTPEEVELLFDTTHKLANAGALTEGKYIGATKALYWQRLSKDN